MLTICRGGGQKRTPRPRVPPAFVGRTRYESSSEKSTGWALPAKEGIFKKVLVPRAGTEAAAAPTVGGAEQAGGGIRGARRRAEGPLGQPGGAGRAAESPGKKVFRLLWSTGEPSAPKPSHQSGQGADRHSSPSRATAVLRPEPQSREAGSVSPGKWGGRGGAFFSPL